MALVAELAHLLVDASARMWFGYQKPVQALALDLAVAWVNELVYVLVSVMGCEKAYMIWLVLVRGIRHSNHGLRCGSWALLLALLYNQPGQHSTA